jgi:hypothetical protein
MDSWSPYRNVVYQVTIFLNCDWQMSHEPRAEQKVEAFQNAMLVAVKDYLSQ